MAENESFINGIVVKAPHENAPDFVKAKLSLKREEVIASLQARSEDWINLDIKVSKAGKWVAIIDAWKPNQGDRKPAPSGGGGGGSDADPFHEDSLDIPFISNRGMW